MTALGILWYVLIFVLIVGYFVLDGFDLGIGVLYPFVAKNETDKKYLARSIGPVWDGNEVWLLTAGGALFAAFAPAYATAFSGFYLAIMLVLFGLILRVVGLELRNMREGNKKLCDIAFFVGSLLPALLCGVAVGNLLVGLPLNAHGDYTGTFLALLNPFALLCGVLGLVHMLGQGAAWIATKTPLESELRAKGKKLRGIFAIVELAVFAVVSILFFAVVMPQNASIEAINFVTIIFIAVYAISLVATLAASFCPKCGECSKNDLLVFLMEALGCVGLVGTWAATLFPTFIPATEVANSITIAVAQGSEAALGAMAIIAAVGVPLVLFYHVLVYRKFAGRLTAEDIAEEY